MNPRQPDPGEMPEVSRRPVRVPTLGISITEAATLYGVARRMLRYRIDAGALAIVRIGKRRKMILHGDHQVLAGYAPRGLETIARAAAGRTVLALSDVGSALGLCRRSVEELAATKELPTFLDELGRRLVSVHDFRAWLRDRRKPTRWERTQRRGAA